MKNKDGTRLLSYKGFLNNNVFLLQDGHTEVIANAAGDRTTPSLVAFSDHDKVRGLDRQ